MSGNSVDYYDVQNMIRDAGYTTGNAIRREVDEVRRDLSGSIEEILGRLADIEQQLDAALGRIDKLEATLRDVTIP